MKHSYITNCIYLKKKINKTHSINDAKINSRCSKLKQELKKEYNLIINDCHIQYLCFAKIIQKFHKNC